MRSPIRFAAVLWVIGLALITGTTGVAQAGLDLTWNACNRSPGGTDNVVFDCSDPGALSSLFGNFQTPTGLPAFVAMDIVLDLQTTSAAPEPFWHFEKGGCNAAGLVLSDARPDAECPAAENANPWGAGGLEADGLVTQYGVGIGGAARARVLITIARASFNPVTIVGAENYFGFKLDFLSNAAGTCPGCATPADIAWSTATLYSADGTPPLTLTDPGLRARSVTVNGGVPGLVAYSLSRSSSYADGPTPLTLYGKNIASSAAVRLTRTGQADLVGQSPTVGADGRSIQATFDLLGRAPGSWNVVVDNPGGAEASITSAFEILDRFRVASITPAVGSRGGEIAARTQGGGFQSGATVRLSRVSGPDIFGHSVVISPDGSTIDGIFDLTIAPVGLYNVAVTNPGGAQAVLSSGFEVVAGPLVSAFAPNIAADTGAVVATISGANFSVSATARLERAGETPIPGQSPFVSAGGTRLTARFDLAGRAHGFWNAVVTNPDGHSATLLNAVRIEPVPVVASVNPVFGLDNASIPITITGANFTPATFARLTLSGATDIIGVTQSVSADGTTLVATFNLVGRFGGLYDVVVTNPSNLYGTLHQGFEVRAGFRVYSIEPAQAADSGAVAVHVRGYAFAPSAQTRLARAGYADILGQGVTVAPDGASLDAVFDLRGQPPGPWDVVVRNSASVTSTLPSAFTILPLPHIAAVSPAQGRDDGSATVAISGTGFASGAAVRLERAGETSIPGFPITLIGSTSIITSFDLNRRAPGRWDLVVTNPGPLTNRLVQGFEILRAPRIVSIVPAAGTQDDSIAVTITGEAFQPGAAAVLRRTGQSDIVGAGTHVDPGGGTLVTGLDLRGRPTGVWDVVVINPDGLDARLANGFTIAGLTVSSIVPPSADNHAPLLVNVQGTGFALAATAKLSLAGEPDIVGLGTLVSPDGRTLSTTLDLRGRATGHWDVTVTNPNGRTATLPQGFEVYAPVVPGPNGIDVTWGACPISTSATGDITFTCESSGDVARLFGSLVLSAGLTGFVAMDGILDFTSQGMTLPPFWQFQSGGCNELGIAISAARPSIECAGTSTPWGINGAAASALITAYGLGIHGPNTGRLLFSIARSSVSPTTLAAGVNYFGFELDFNTDNATSCAGCATPTTIVFQQCVLYSVSGLIAPESAPVVLTEIGIRNKIATLNGGAGPVTAVTLSRFEADPVAGGIEVHWAFADAGRLADVTLERAESAAGPWAAIAAPAHAEGDGARVLDGDVVPGHDYFYRLRVATAAGSFETFGPIGVTARGAGSVFGILAITPNPGPGPLRIAYTLARETPARLTVVDVQGREVAVLAEGTAPAGRHEAVWSGATRQGMAPAGVYFACLVQGAERATRRLVFGR